MKVKNLVLVGLVGMAFTFTACKKDWTCVCPDYSENYTIKNKTEKKAKKQCTESIGIPVPGMTNMATNNCHVEEGNVMNKYN